MSWLKRYPLLLVAMLTVSLTGCQLMPHALQGNQLRKLNRGPALGRDAYNFSVPDPPTYTHKVDGLISHDPFEE